MYPVVADLEPGKSGTGALARLELGDETRRVVADGPQAVELGVEPGSDDPAVANDDRRRLDDGRLEVRPEPAEVVDPGREIGRERPVEPFDPLAYRGEDAESGAKLGEIAGTRGPDRDPGEDPLEIADRAQQIRGPRLDTGLDPGADELPAGDALRPDPATAGRATA